MEADIYRQFYEFEKDHWWSKGMRHLCASAVNRYHIPDISHRILDIGCGTGEMTRSLNALGKTYGADIADEAIAFCRKRGIKRLIRTSAQTAGLKDGVFSTVVAFCLIEHIDDDAAFLKEMSRIMERKGHIVILTSAFSFLWSEHDELAHHKRRYRLGQLKALMQENGFIVKKASYVNSFLFPVIAVIRMMQRFFRIHTSSEKKFVLDFVKLPRLINSLFYALLVAESNIMKYIDLPVGVGILCIGQKS
jgi:ubiquinone/menaquinone biosynthesis C-methylase UbiE